VDQAAVRLSKERNERGSGGRRRTPEPRFLVIGEIIGVHGLQGELKVELHTDDPNRFRLLNQVFLSQGEEEPVARALLGFRLHKGRALLRLEGYADRTTAEALRGWLVQVPLTESIPLLEGEYFEHQIVDLDVWTRDGEYLGVVDSIIYTGANEVYVVHGPVPNHPEILIPALRSVILDIDLEAGRLTVELPPGLL